MKNFKKFGFLILIICMIFMVGAVSAVDVEDSFSSENSNVDLSAVPDESDNISESDVLSSEDVEPTVASDAFDSDELSSNDAETLGADPDLWLYYHTGYVHYHDELLWTIVISNAPTDNVDFKVTANGFDISKLSAMHDGYTYIPETSTLHFDALPSGTHQNTMYVEGYPNIVGNPSVVVEMIHDNEVLYTLQNTITVDMEQVDLTIEKSLSPFPELVPTVYIPPIYLAPNPELLGQSGSINPGDSSLLSNDDDIPIVNIGDEVIWYVRLINEGPDSAYDVNITDVIPDGLIFKNFTAKTGSTTFTNDNYNRDFGDEITYENGIFHIPKLLATQYVDLTISTIANKVGLITNIANVTSDCDELNPDNDESNASVRVIGEELLDEPQEDDNETTQPDPENVSPSEDEVTADTPEKDTPEEDTPEEETPEETPDNTVSKTAKALPVKAATGNPVLLALIALFVASGDIFRRKK